LESRDAVRLTDRLHAEQGKGDPFAAAVRATRMPMLITDPRQDDNPIVFANDAFLALTGYSRDEVMGANCRFLQGEKTDRAEVARVRDAIEKLTDVNVELLNYRKDGTEFWNALYISPVFGEHDDLQFFFASQFDVTDRKMREIEAREGKNVLAAAVEERTSELTQALEQKTILLHEVDHRVKNNLQMVAGMLRNQSRFTRDDATKRALDAAVRRVETLGVVHQSIYQSGDVREVDASGIVEVIAESVVAAWGRAEIVLEKRLDTLRVSSTFASPLALLANELITNTMKHAFPDGRQGKLRIELATVEDVSRILIEDNGVGMRATQSDRPTFGSRLVTSLVRQLDGEMTTTEAAPGTSIVVTFPSIGKETA
jgi:PAS domain S-box-containing protein